MSDDLSYPLEQRWDAVMQTIEQRLSATLGTASQHSKAIKDNGKPKGKDEEQGAPKDNQFNQG